MKIKFEKISRLPVFEVEGAKCFLDTGLPFREATLHPVSQKFIGVPGIKAVGVAFLKRYTKIDFKNCEIETADTPIQLTGAKSATITIAPSGWMVEMTVGNKRGLCYIDTGAAYSYVPGQWEGYESAGEVGDCGFSGRPWKTDAHKVPCSFEGIEFTALCGKCSDNREMVPSNGVIGTDFFERFTIVVDRVAGYMQYIETA